ncbi:MAG: hypothetical protein CMO55_02100 [Verrucomicrobiales bacterium]|nr:hypothetical protein [Verrucomicrobiales bacterium]
MSSFFENLGRKLGRSAVPTYRKAKWVWDGLTGTEEEALQAEKEMGSNMAAELRLAMDMVDEPELLAWIRRIARRLQNATGQEGRAYHCELMRSEHPSVIALPGGYLFLSRSMIDFCHGKTDEIAFVMAHEMAHVARRHTWDRMVQQSALKAASFATMRAGFLAGWLRQQGLPMLRSAHSKTFEFEADGDALELMRKAEFDPEGAFSFLKRIDTLDGDPEEVGEYFASHPPSQERIQVLKG